MIKSTAVWYSSRMAADGTSEDLGDERKIIDRPREQDVDLDQITERLRWTPRQRLHYLLDMLEFEDKAHRCVKSNAQTRIVNLDWTHEV